MHDIHATNDRSIDLLLIEDHPGLRYLLEIMLNDAGYSLISAEHGAHALTLLERVRPRLILLDLDMPVMNGWEFRAAQLQNTNLADIPVILLSAELGLAQQAAALGTAWHPKPPHVDALLALIAQFCPPRPGSVS